jgi:pantothenate kinase
MSESPREPPQATSLSDLIERARKLAAQDRRTLLGIAGAPGAGKSVLAETIVMNVGNAARLVGMDGFHLSQARLTKLGSLGRKGAMDTFDAAGFVELMRRLKDPDTTVIHAPKFHREIEESIAGEVSIEPDVRLVVAEGNYLLVPDEPWGGLRLLFDEVWYRESDEQTRIANLIARHREYGKTRDEAIRWALGPDQRNAELVAMTRTRADLIVRLHIPIADCLPA